MEELKEERESDANMVSVICEAHVGKIAVQEFQAIREGRTSEITLKAKGRGGDTAAEDGSMILAYTKKI